MPLMPWVTPGAVAVLTPLPFKIPCMTPSIVPPIDVVPIGTVVLVAWIPAVPFDEPIIVEETGI
jgi:hypothetical protein